MPQADRWPRAELNETQNPDNGSLGCLGLPRPVEAALRAHTSTGSVRAVWGCDVDFDKTAMRPCRTRTDSMMNSQGAIRCT